LLLPGLHALTLTITLIGHGHGNGRLAAEDGATIVLSGLGSEELFAGYRRHASKVGQGFTEENLT